MDLGIQFVFISQVVNLVVCVLDLVLGDNKFVHSYVKQLRDITFL